MAILSKIRERSIALIAIIGLALFAFVLDPSTLSDFFSSNKVNEIGQVNGEKITREEFAAALENYKNQAGNGVPEMQAAQIVWDNLVREKIYASQLEKAGITVGEEDVWAELIEQPSVKTNPQFQNQAGLFDEQSFKQFLANARENDPNMWSAWQNYMTQIKGNLQTTTYNNLVSSGLGASLKEGELQYINDNLKISAQFVFVPYTTIADSLVKVTSDDVSRYIKSHKKDFSVDASRDISYVKFDVAPTFEDEEALKNSIAKLMEDRKEYSSVAKGEINIDGFKNTKNLSRFFEENNSEIPLDTAYKFKNEVSQEISENVFNANKGDVFGPYKDNGYLKLTKVLEVSKLPDSVKARHILLSFIGSRSATAETIQSEAEAKKTADSLVTVLKQDRNKFAELAKEFSTDKSNSDDGGSLDKFAYNRMVPEFRDFSFNNSKGTIGVAKTDFGFHVIEIESQTAAQNVVKLATFGRRIVASEETENEVFQKSEKFSLAVTENNKFLDVAAENNYTARPAIGLKVLDENIPGLGNQREIVRWTFEKDVEVGDFKRFDIQGGHIVAHVTNKTEKGLMSPANAMNAVKPRLLNEKKATIINDTFSGESLEALAKSTNTTIRNVSDVTFKAPTISGIGFEPKIVGAMSNAKIDKLHSKVEGDKGVFAFVVTKVEMPAALPTYETMRNQISQARKNQTNKLYEAVKKAADIEDYRAIYFGSNVQ